MAEIRGACCVELSAGANGTLPTEVRIFAKGWNRTTKGDLLFDEESAKLVMARYLARGVDPIIDLNHDSDDPDAMALRSDAGDARGWWRPEIRNGELWVVSLRWTDDGAARVREKRQRYLSPVAAYDPKTRRVLEVRKAALVADPATYGAQPLIAASRSVRGSGATGDRAIQGLVTLALAATILTASRRDTHGSKTSASCARSNRKG